MNKFDIFIVDFKYDDSDEYKRRPAVILNDFNVAALVSKITSHAPRSNYPGEIQIKDLKSAGLKKSSTIRLSKIIKINKTSIYKKLGHLSDEDISSLRKAAKSMNINLESNYKTLKLTLNENSNNDIPKYLYHATYKPFYKSIIAKGLGNTNRKMWSDSKGKGTVYLSTEPEVAYSYAETSEWLDDVEDYDKYADNIIVLVIDTDKLDKSKLSVDENVILDSDVDPTYEYHGIIDSSAIVKIVDEQGKSINESGDLNSEVNMIEESNESIKKIKPTLVICKTDSLGHSVWPKDAQEDDDDFWTNLYVSQYGEPLI